MFSSSTTQFSASIFWKVLLSAVLFLWVNTSALHYIFSLCCGIFFLMLKKEKQITDDVKRQQGLDISSCLAGLSSLWAALKSTGRTNEYGEQQKQRKTRNHQLCLLVSLTWKTNLPGKSCSLASEEYFCLVEWQDDRKPKAQVDRGAKKALVCPITQVSIGHTATAYHPNPTVQWFLKDYSPRLKA